MDDLKKYQVKSITPVDRYVCKLSDELRQIAKDDLNETDENRDKAIREIREWVLHNDRILMCRLDSIFILRFLRFHRFNIERAKDSIERWILVYENARHEKSWYASFDYTKLRHIDELVKNKALITLPKKDKFNRTVLLTRLICFDPNTEHLKEIISELFSLTLIGHEIYMDDEENQIRGIIIITDAEHATITHALKSYSIPMWWKILRNTERGLKCHLKGSHLVNLPSTVKFLAKIVIHEVTRKSKIPVIVHSDVNGMRECSEMEGVELPKEYGGSLEVDNLTLEWYEKLVKNHKLLLSYQKLKLDTSFYPKVVLKMSTESFKKPLAQWCADKKMNKVQ